MHEPSTSFDFDEIDRRNGWNDELSLKAQETTQHRVDAINTFMDWLWRTPSGRQRTAKSAIVRLVATSAAVNPDYFDNQSYETIARTFGVTRAYISKAALEMSDELGVHFRRSKLQASREAYRRDKLRNHWRIKP